MIISALHAEREQRLNQLAALQQSFAEMVAASESSNADDEHDPEGATIAFERSALSAQISHSQAGLDGIEAALARIGTGDYGTCASCAPNRPRPTGRLADRDPLHRLRPAPVVMQRRGELTASPVGEISGDQSLYSGLRHRPILDGRADYGVRPAKCPEES